MGDVINIDDYMATKNQNAVVVAMFKQWVKQHNNNNDNATIDQFNNLWSAFSGVPTDA